MQTYTVIHARNPFNPARDRSVSTRSRRVRLAALAPKTEQPFICLVNGVPVLRAEWDKRPLYGDIVAFVTLPQGGGQGKSIINTILTIVLIYYGGVAGQWAAGQLGLSAGIGSMLGMAAGGALANAVIGPPQMPTPQQQAAMAAASPTYSMGAQGNSARLGSSIPVQYGRHLAYMDFAADPYVEYVGNEQFLFQLLVIGQGSFDIEDIRIEDTPLSSFNDITYEVVQPGGTVTLFPVNVITSIEVAGQEALTSTTLGPFVANSAGTVANFIGIDLICPKGLYYANSNGSLSSKSVGFLIEARLIDNNGDPLGSWFTLTTALSAPGAATLAEASASYSSDLLNTTYYVRIAALDAAGVPTLAGTESNITLSGGYSSDGEWKGARIQCNWTAVGGAAGYQVWVGTASGTQNHYFVSQTNSFIVSCLGDAIGGVLPAANLTGGTYTAGTNTPQRFSLRYVVSSGRYEVRLTRTDTKDTSAQAGHDLNWAGLRTYLPGDQQYGSATLIAMRMKATNNLSQLASRRVNAICTRKLPAWHPTTGWAAAAATRSIAWAFADACRADYGGKLPDAQIPLAQLYALDAVWAARGDTFDGRFDNMMTLWEALTQIARVGRAKCYQQGGVVQIVRDQAQSVPVALFSPRNIVRGSLKVDYLMPTTETADAVIVKFFDATTWRPKEVTAALAGSSAANPATVQLFGCTSRDQAWREGMYIAACNRYRRKPMILKTEMEGFIPTFGDLVAISSDRMTRAQAGEVTGWVAGTKTLTLSEPLTWTVGQAHYFGLRKRDGSFSGPWQATAGVDEFHAVLSSTPDITPYTGSAEERTHFTFGTGTAYRQLAIMTSTRPRGSNQVELALVNEDALVHTADQGTAPAPPAVWELPRVPTVPAVTGLNVVQGGTPTAPALAISWQPAPGADHYLVEQSADGVAWTGAGSPTNTSMNLTIPVGDLQVRVAAVGLTRGAWALLVVIGESVRPPGITNLSINGNELSWTPVDADGAIPDLAGYLFKYQFGNNLDWGTAVPLHQGIITSSPFTVTTLPYGIATIMGKAVDLVGNESTASGNIFTNLGDAPLAYIIETFNFDAESYPGVLENCTLSGGDLIADVLDSFYGTDAQSFYGPDTDPFYAASAYAQMSYITSTIKPALVLVGSAMTLLHSTQGIDLSIEYRLAGPTPFYGADTDPFYGADADPFYDVPGAWMVWPGQITATDDSYEFRLTIGAGALQGKITSLSLVVDAPDMSEEIGDLGIAASATAIPYSKPFTAIKGVQATLQANSSGAITVEINKTAPLAPTILAYNAAHTAVAGATADITLRGY